MKQFLVALWWLSAAMLATAARAAETTLVVAADGSGQFTKVQDAVMAVPDGRRESPVVIHIKPGAYRGDEFPRCQGCAINGMSF